MPIDASIPLQARAPQVRSPMDAYTRAAQAKNIMLQGEQARMQVDKMRQEEEERRKEKKKTEDFAAILTKRTKTNSKGLFEQDTKGVISDLIAGGYPELAGQWEAGRREADKAKKEATAEELEKDIEQGEMIGQLAGSVLDAPPEQQETMYRAVLAQASQLYPDRQHGLDEQWSTDLIPELTIMRYMGLDGAQQATAERARKVAEIAKAEKAEAKRQERLKSTQPTQGQLDKFRQGFEDRKHVNAAMKDPAYYHNLTPAVRTRIGPGLSEQGFTQWKDPEKEEVVSPQDKTKAARVFEEKKAKAESDYEKAIKVLEKDLNLRYSDPIMPNFGRLRPEISKTKMNTYRQKAEVLFKRKEALIRAAREEYEAIGGEDHPEATGRRRWNPETQGLEDY